MGDRKGENAERSAIMWKQMLWSLRTSFGPLIKMAENVLTVSEAMPRAPALRSSNFSSLQMQRYIYAERAVNISLTPLLPSISFPRSLWLRERQWRKEVSMICASEAAAEAPAMRRFAALLYEWSVCLSNTDAVWVKQVLRLN